jgi:tetratricopeptide (TPR) repeat protein
MGSAERGIKIKLQAGMSHQYSIYLNAGEYAHVKVEQHGIDVIASVSAAKGEWLEIFDTPSGELDSEDIYLLSEFGDKYQITIYPAQKYADPGEYSLRIIRLKMASGADKKWMAALVATQQADKLRSKAGSRQQSILQYESALSLWKQLNDTEQYAHTLRSLGFVHIREKNYEKSVQVFNQLLLLWKQLGDVRAEGFTYLIIGRIYDLQKNYSQSLAYNLSSLDYWKKTADTDQESFVLMNIGNMYTKSGDKQKAIDYFEQALKINQQSERPSIKAVILRDYANAMAAISENERAIYLYDQSLKQWQATVNLPEEARTAVLLAVHFADRDDRQKAIQYYQHALAIWKKLDDQKELKVIQAALDKFVTK